MNPYRWPVICGICGGEGVGTIQTASKAWLPNFEIVHSDPRVCRDNLRRQQEEQTSNNDSK